MTSRTDTPTLIKALRILVRDIHCEDGVATVCIAEAADRLEELSKDLETLPKDRLDEFWQETDPAERG